MKYKDKKYICRSCLVNIKHSNNIYNCDTCLAIISSHMLKNIIGVDLTRIVVEYTHKASYMW